MSNQYPMDVINATNWKITLPINSAQEIKQPALATYADVQWFHLNDAKDGAVFMARTDGAHTSGSSNPRSELREMSADGTANAAWSTYAGTHSMEIEQSVDVLPIGSKPHCVVGQIHNSSDDITVFRLEGSTTDRSIGSLWITKGDTTHGYLVTDAYKLGTKFTVGFKVANGVITYSYNGIDIGYALSKKTSGCYFKAGCYNQSGGIVTPLPDGSADFAQVTIYNLQVCHDGVCTGNAPGTVTEPPPTTDTVDRAAVNALMVELSSALDKAIKTAVDTLKAM